MERVGYTGWDEQDAMSTANKLTAPLPVHTWGRDILGLLQRPVRILSSYKREDFQPDVIAGLTVAIVMLPQAIAYALIAELPPQMGIYTAIVAAVAGALWGSSAHLHTGPTNAASLLVLATLLPLAAPGTPGYLAAAGLMAIMVGLIRLLMGFARLGVLVNFVADSVIIGFTAGAGILISVNQLRTLLRLSFPSDDSLFTTVTQLIRHAPGTHWFSLGLGLGTIAAIVVVRRFRPSWPGPLITMIVASLLVAVLGLDQLGVLVLGELPRNLPPIASLPLLDLDLIGQLSTGALAVATIGLVEAISIARSIATHSGQRLDSSQEFIGQGLANVVAGVFSGYACSGSFTRSAVNYTAGARTPLASVFSGVWVLIALLLFAPLTAYLPRSALAGVLIVTAYGMVDRREMRRIWRTSRGDSAIMIATLLATLLLPLQFAVLSGMLVSFARFIVRTSTPAVYPVVPDENFQHFVRQEQQPACPQLGIMTIGGSLYFGAAPHAEAAIHTNLERHPDQRFLLLRMHLVDHCDVTGIHMLEAIVRMYRKRGGDVFIVGVRPPVEALMRSSGFEQWLGRDHFLSRENAVSYLFHRILDPAICIYACGVRIFAECQALPKHQASEQIRALTSASRQEIPQWLPSELKERIGRNGAPPEVVLVDVREPHEYEHGHIPKAQSLPMRLMIQRGRGLPTDQPIILVCRSGRRSRLAASMLQDLGYTKVYILQGGMLAWEAAGYPVAVE